MMGTVICVLQYSYVGRLHIKGVDLPEKLHPGDVVVVDPNCVHKGTAEIRECERRILALVL